MGKNLAYEIALRGRSMYEEMEASLLALGVTKEGTELTPILRNMPYTQMSTAARDALALQLAGPGTDPKATLYGVDVSRGEDRTVYCSVNARGDIRVWHALKRRGPHWQFKNGSVAPIEGVIEGPIYIVWDRSLGCEVAYAR